MIDTILFDLDNTILDFDKAEEIALTKAFRALNIEPTEQIMKRYSEINLAQWKLLERGKITRDEVKTGRYALLFDEFEIDCSADLAESIYEKNLGIGHYYLDGAEELLQILHNQYRLYIVTNGMADVQKGRIQSAKLRDYCQDIFISEEIGFNKPRREFFDFCFAKIPAFSKDKSVIIGDSLTSDIQGGINAGIQTIWFNHDHIKNASDVQPDYVIDSLNEIKPILNSLN